MAHNKLYRNFIILQEDERGYSHANDKALSGYAKIEAKGDKCKVSFYAQNLTQEDKYSMVLICCKRDLKQLINIGPLAINEVGKGDTSKEYYVNNIAGLGISYEKVSGAAICRMKDSENEFVMHGFMNGEESTDNWRKFKFVKADSPKYVSKLDSEIVSKDIITNKSIATQASDDFIKTSKLTNELVERKQDEINLHKENIELGKLNDKNSKVNEEQNRIPENYANIAETKDDFSEDRKKCKESKKEEKKDKCDKCDEYNHYEKNENIENLISKLANNLDTYEGIMDVKINHHIDADVIVYGFIKNKNDYNCKWKKFKLEKKCRTDSQDFEEIQSSRRIEENFKLDKLNNSERLDIMDFDKYENDIKKANLNKSTGMEIKGDETTGTGMGAMNETGTVSQQGTTAEGTGTMTSTGPEKITYVGTGTPSQPVTTEKEAITVSPTEAEGMTKPSCNICGQLNLSDGEIPSVKNKQPSIKLDISGSIGKFFEKIAEGFTHYLGNLTDINYCKWYKIDVNGIEDLSDESNYNQYTLAYYPMLNYYPYISKTGHFLLGYKCNRNGDIKHIIYAIPGSKEKNDQPYGGRTGFVTWTNDEDTGRGYWLMFYDFKNSSIVIPTK